ncbi:MAG: hypothetical protein J0M35_19120 [Candidatus Obscuribacter phosphatis]|uniref:Uncharacterized protein n=1 Tax=Candidatus Obscuribacter phosphatis TaxID=1906157 RepID=A0A8J7P918_9BACT|nr:hypothetical protein [Candidatus Obscuribacter phosphatis]
MSKGDHILLPVRGLYAESPIDNNSHLSWYEWLVISSIGELACDDLFFKLVSKVWKELVAIHQPI